MESKFGHPRLHARRQVSGSSGVCGYRESLDGRLNLAGCGLGRTALHLLPARSLLRLLIEPQAAGLFRGDFDISENRADRIALTFLDKDLGKATCARRSDSHDSLVCLDFNYVAVGFHGAPLFEQDLDDRCLGDGFTELWH
jgi:hypothetical protein